MFLSLNQNKGPKQVKMAEHGAATSEPLRRQSTTEGVGPSSKVGVMRHLHPDGCKVIPALPACR